jgi:hypothetical protein
LFSEPFPSLRQESSDCGLSGSLHEPAEAGF